MEGLVQLIGWAENSMCMSERSTDYASLIRNLSGCVGFALHPEEAVSAAFVGRDKEKRHCCFPAVPSQPEEFCQLLEHC